MKITFLGTGADTAYPLPFCRCVNCTQARELGGKNFRKRSSVIINDDLLIDLGPDIMPASFMHNISIADIRYCLQTHSHSDHFNASHLSTRLSEYACVNAYPLEIYASEGTLRKMSEMLKNEGYINDLFESKEQERMNLKVHRVLPLQTFPVGKYEVTAFLANHDDSVESLLYSVKENETVLFYGTDTNDLPEETWDGFHKIGVQFNILILDHTYGPNISSGGHLSADKFISHINRMRKENLLTEQARIIATHISHEGNPVHEELEKFASKNGYEIGYDGLVI